MPDWRALLTKLKGKDDLPPPLPFEEEPGTHLLSISLSSVITALRKLLGR